MSTTIPMKPESINSFEEKVDVGLIPARHEIQIDLRLDGILISNLNYTEIPILEPGVGWAGLEMLDNQYGKFTLVNHNDHDVMHPPILLKVLSATRPE